MTKPDKKEDKDKLKLAEVAGKAFAAFSSPHPQSATKDPILRPITPDPGRETPKLSHEQPIVTDEKIELVTKPAR